ncbi:MAG: septum formation initiator family protein [Candidatus Kaelpia aquatica]|nr:septum formation initiator family protein [Candidatus Kaelpia aquatica]
MVRRVKKRFLQGLGLILLLGFIYYPGYKKVQEAKMRNRILEEELSSLSAKNKELKKKLELLETDMVYIEKRAREKLGVVGEGEIIYDFVTEN